jgi:Raf kinase inhibitor-like YbhB/YbcL family protein
MIAIVLAATLMQQASLSDAVLYGDARAAQSLIAGGADVNAMDDTGMTPLMVAASEGRTAIARMLIAAGANVNASSQDGSDALMRAASANRVEVMKLLLASGADANARSSSGMTALMVAAFGGYADAVRTLLASRANPNAKDTQGRTALMAAAASGDTSTLEALVAAGGDPTVGDAGGSTPLTYAAAEGHAEALAVLRKRGLEPGAGDLTLAAAGCHRDVVRSILADGVNVNGAEGDVVPLLSAAGDNCVEVVQMLLDRGAKVDAKDRNGRTALIRASQAGHLEMVRLLLQHGADINIRDESGRTAWTFAAMSGRLDIAELFKQARAQAAAQRLEVTSAALEANQPIPKQYTADGRNDSPPLAWSDVPEGTKSLAVVCEDPDAGNPPPFVHWVIYNIPPDAKGLPEAIPFEPDRPMPKEIAGATQGVSGFRRAIYRGPAPPPGKVHHYHFVVYALDTPADLKPGLTRADLLDAVKGHILGQGELVATYERK